MSPQHLEDKNFDAIVEILKKVDKNEIKILYQSIPQFRENIIEGIMESLLWTLYTAPDAIELLNLTRKKFKEIEDLIIATNELPPDLLISNVEAKSKMLRELEKIKNDNRQ